MANGIDRRYTGIPIIPQVVEEKTSMWDALVPLARMAKQEKLLAEKKALDWEKIRIEKESNADMADYRAGVLSNQRTQESNLQLDRGEKNAIANKNAQAVQDQVKLKGKEAYYKGFPAYQRAQLQMRDPDYLRLTGTTKADYEPLLENYDNISDFVDNAGSLQFSKNLKKIDAAMKHANTFETKDPRLSALKLQLAEQYQTVKDVKEKEYEVTPAEIQEAYPEFAYQIKNIAMTAQAPEGDLKKLMEEGKLLEIAQRGIIPQDKLPAFNAQMTQLREFYQRKYRKEHDIGEYEKLIPFSQLTAAQKAQAGPHAETAAGQRAEEDPYMVPITGGEVGIAEGSYGISDKQYDLLEKTMETNEDLWDRWIGEDDYTFADLETDYEAGLRAETDEPTEKELEEAELKAQQVSVEREEPEVEVETEPEKGPFEDIDPIYGGKKGTAVVLDPLGGKKSINVTPKQAAQLYDKGNLVSFESERDPLKLHTGKGAHSKVEAGTTVYDAEGDEFKIDKIVYVTQNYQMFPDDIQFGSLSDEMKAKASEVSSRNRVHLYKIGKEYYNRREAEKLFRLDKPFKYERE